MKEIELYCWLWQYATDEQKRRKIEQIILDCSTEKEQLENKSKEN